MSTRIQVCAFGFLLGCSGVPIYIHLPRFASADLGIGLALVGAILIGIRVFDFVQDPFLGRLVDRFPGAAGRLSTMSIIGLALGFLLVFSFPYEPAPANGLTLGLIILLTSYSLATIQLYNLGRRFSGAPLRKVSAFRETGIIAGILVGSIVPSVLAGLVGFESRYSGFGLFVAFLATGILVIAGPIREDIGQTLRATQKVVQTAFVFTPNTRRLIILAFVNAMPVAITSTLFLFFVEDVLGKATFGGAFLASFFLSAGLFVPVWNRLSKRFGMRNTLSLAMTLAILGFVGAAFLSPQSADLFWIICIVTGMAVGADMILLPVLFTSVLIHEKQPAGQAFGLWFLASKLSLAGAAAFALPVLEFTGFTPGETNTRSAVNAVILLYSAVPCVLKILSIVMIRTIPKEVYLP